MMIKNMRIIDVHLKSTAKTTVDVAAQVLRAQKILTEITLKILCFSTAPFIPWTQNAYTLLYQPRRRDASSMSIYALIWT